MSLEQWQLELQQCVRSLDQLEKYLPLENKDRLRETLAHMRLSITPHTLRLINFADPRDPLLLMCVPRIDELIFLPEELADPIGDEVKSPVPFLTHRYPDRALIHVTYFCAQFCRFCFRRAKTGEAHAGPSQNDVEHIVDYLLDHPEIDEVILSGGDPLTLIDAQLDAWLLRLRDISSIIRIRIHTRVLVNLPSRITDHLVDIFKAHMSSTKPIYIVTHFNHPREITADNITAIAKLVDAGIVVRNQGPLLRGINDDAATLAELYKRLVDIRVAPYYLHQLDLAQGTNHFRVPIKRGIEIMRSLQGKISGLALPKYVLDLPGGRGKVPLV